jgi:uncharacterized Zn finger protein (UPF0148 family)
MDEYTAVRGCSKCGEPLLEKQPAGYCKVCKKEYQKKYRESPPVIDRN